MPSLENWEWWVKTKNISVIPFLNYLNTLHLHMLLESMYVDNPYLVVWTDITPIVNL